MGLAMTDVARVLAVHLPAGESGRTFLPVRMN